VPDFPPEEGRGNHFAPFNLEYRDFQINPLPKEPLKLFQVFVPISLVQSWIEYTNDWVACLMKNAVIDSWNSPISEHSRILRWNCLSTATGYIRIGIMIYLGIHREISIKDHWKSPRVGDQRPLHPITKFMPLRKFELIHGTSALLTTPSSMCMMRVIFRRPSKRLNRGLIIYRRCLLCYLFQGLI
jgi:hypothetical protein